MIQGSGYDNVRRPCSDLINFNVVPSGNTMQVFAGHTGAVSHQTVCMAAATLSIIQTLIHYQREWFQG
jgi:hypothetical protein